MAKAQKTPSNTPSEETRKAPDPAEQHLAWLNQQKHRRAVVEVRRSSTEKGVWILELVCGHRRRMGTDLRPSHTEIACIDCALNLLAKYEGGRAIMADVEKAIRNLRA